MIYIFLPNRFGSTTFSQKTFLGALLGVRVNTLYNIDIALFPNLSATSFLVLHGVFGLLQLVVFFMVAVVALTSRSSSISSGMRQVFVIFA